MTQLEDAIAFTLFLQTWKYDDDDETEFYEKYATGLREKWEKEFLPELEKNHNGDCCKQPWTCTRCYMESVSKQAKLIAASFNT